MTSSALTIQVRRLPHGEGLELPQAATVGSAGVDLRAAIAEPIDIAPGERRLVGTGIVIELPAGFEGQVRPRSGLALEHGLTVLNAPGTIDCDYRGEVKVLLINLGGEPVSVVRGQRIAQLVVAACSPIELREAQALTESSRGSGGFGSSGAD